MVVEVEKNEDIKGFVVQLNYLIETTIHLPEAAKFHFKSQWNEESIRNQLGKWLFLIAKDESGNINGVLLGSPPEGGVATIVWVLVDRITQNKGLGARLFEKARQIYKDKNVHKIKLTVPDEQTVKFYKKQGMVLEGIHRNHWWRHDFWSMGLEINN